MDGVKAEASKDYLGGTYTRHSLHRLKVAKAAMDHDRKPCDMLGSLSAHSSGHAAVLTGLTEVELLVQHALQVRRRTGAGQ